MNTSTAIKKLTQARNIIDDQGWCRGFYTDRQGHHCIYGALREVGWDHFRELADLLMDDIEQLPLGGLAVWNDHKNRRKRDVIRLFDRTIQRLKTREVTA